MRTSVRIVSSPGGVPGYLRAARHGQLSPSGASLESASPEDQTQAFSFAQKKFAFSFATDLKGF